MVILFSIASVFVLVGISSCAGTIEDLPAIVASITGLAGAYVIGQGYADGQKMKSGPQQEEPSRC